MRHPPLTTRSDHGALVRSMHKIVGQLSDIYVGHAGTLDPAGNVYSLAGFNMELLPTMRANLSTGIIGLSRMHARNGRLAVGGNQADQAYLVTLHGRYIQDLDTSGMNNPADATPDDDGGAIVVHDVLPPATIDVFRFDSDGALDWTYSTGNPALGCCAMRSDGSVAIGALGFTNPPDKIIVLSAAGALVWTYPAVTPIRGIAVDDDDNVYAAGQRQLVPALSVWKLTAAGALDWSYDTGGICYDVAIGPTNVLAVGYRTAGVCAWALSKSAGALDWSIDLGANITGATYSAEAAAWYVCGTRNNSWTGAGGVYASIWKISTAGAILDTYDEPGGPFSIEARR